MFAKIAAGILAAVAVTGGGVYYATSDTNCKSGCPLSRTDAGPVSVTTDAPTSCSAQTQCGVPTPQNESLGACTGAATLVSTVASKPAHACCSDE